MIMIYCMVFLFDFLLSVDAYKAVLNSGTQTRLFKDKNPERNSMTSFEFLQRPKVT